MAAITAVILLLVNVLVMGGTKAIQDTLDHHWDQSIFAKWAGGDRRHFFGHADFVYLRRYTELADGTSVRKGLFTIPIIAAAVEAVYDLDHLAATFRIVFVAGSLTFALGLPWWMALVAWGLYHLAFEIPYRALD